MATHLVAKRCDLGSTGVPALASTPCGRQAAGGRRAVAPTLTPLVSTHPPKIAIPLLGGTSGRLGPQWPPGLHGDPFMEGPRGPMAKGPHGAFCNPDIGPSRHYNFADT